MPELHLSGGSSRNFIYSLLSTPFPQVLNLRQISFSTPVICVLFAVFRTLDKQIVYPENHEARNYLDYMQRACSYMGGSRYIPVVNITSVDRVIEINQRFREIFRNWLPEEAAASFASYGLSELMDNVFHHAQSKFGVWIQAQKYPYSDCIEMCIADLGRGIATSMADNPEYYSLSPERRFVLSLQVGGTRAPGDHNGEGLACVVHWIKENPGAEGILISCEYIWLKTPEYREGFYTTKHVSWPGTFIWLKIPKKPKYSLVDIWEMLDLQPEPSV